MEIDLSKGCYCFKNDETSWDCTAEGVFQAKQVYLKHISDEIDKAIDNSLWKLNEIEKTLNTTDSEINGR